MLLASTIGESIVPVLRASRSAFLLVAALSPVGCGGDDSAGAGGGSGGGPIFNMGAGGATVAPPPPPSAFTDSDVGSYAVGEPIMNVPSGISIAGQMGSGCDLMVGVVRDFK